MTEHPGAARAGLAALDDWVTIWQSELAALVVDREWLEAQQRLVDGWGAQARAALRLIGAGLDAAAGPARADAPARPPPAAAAPDERDAVIRQLLDRVAELERRMAEREPPGA